MKLTQFTILNNTLHNVTSHFLLAAGSVCKYQLQHYIVLFHQHDMVTNTSLSSNMYLLLFYSLLFYPLLSCMCRYGPTIVSKVLRDLVSYHQSQVPQSSLLFSSPLLSLLLIHYLSRSLFSLLTSLSLFLLSHLHSLSRYRLPCLLSALSSL